MATPAVVKSVELAGRQAKVHTAAAARAETGSSVAISRGMSAKIAAVFQSSVDASCMSVPPARTLMRRLALNCAARIRIGTQPLATMQEGAA